MAQKKRKSHKKKESLLSSFITYDYPDVIKQETYFSAFWHVCTVIFIILLMFWPRQIGLWIGLCFFALISITLLLASRGKPIPSVAIPILLGINEMFEESSENNEYFEQVKDKESILGIVYEGKYDPNDVDEYADNELSREEEYEDYFDKPYMADDDDYEEEVSDDLWKK